MAVATRWVLDRLLFSKVFEQLPVGVLVVDAPSGQLVMHNAQMERIWGCGARSQRHTVIATRPNGTEYFPEELPLSRALRTGEHVRGEEMRIVRSDGTASHLRVDAGPLEGENGERRVVAVFEDITELKESELAAATLASVVAGSQDPIITLDANGMICSWNGGAQRLYGYSESEAVGQHFSLVATPETLPQSLWHVRGVFAGENFGPIEVEHIKSSGDRIVVSVVLSPVIDPAGRVVAASVIGRDVTEKKQAEEQLLRANAIKDEFLGLVSHEMRNPLTSVAGLAEALSRRFDDIAPDARREALDQILLDARRLQRLIENMLVLARLDHDDIDLEPILMQHVLVNVVEDHKARLAAAGQPLVVSIEPNLPPINARETWVEQLVENLLNNAEKYGNGSEVTLDVRAQNGGVVVRVLDCGPGISAEQAEEVFLPFRRLERDRFRAYGSGLGLAVCKRLVDLMGGAIWACPRPTGGSEFGFWLPTLADSPD